MSFFTSLFSVSRLRRAGLALCVFAFLFAGCTLDPEPEKENIEGLNPDIIGTWTSSSGDYYVITEDHLTCYSGGETISWAGEIVTATEFTKDDGVIIIKYDADHKQTYYAEWNEDWTPVLESAYPSKGDYIGIYYNDLISFDTVKMCVAYVAPDGAEQPTLAAAKSEFTAANQGTYASNPPAYEWTKGKIEGLSPDIIGTWTQAYGDYFVITENHLTYYGGDDMVSWAGEIVAAAEFTDDDGVIIIKYDADHKQYYYEEWDPITFEPILDSVYPSKGDYIGIYYNDLVSVDQVNMCVAYATPDGAEQPTLAAAKAEFTAANHGTYAGYQPVYEWTVED